MVGRFNWMMPWDIQIAGLVQYRSGQPWNVTTGRDNNLDADGATNDRPDLAVPEGNPLDRATYFADFTNRSGNLGRNTNTGPSFVTIDTRLSKFVKMQRFRVEAFIEAFNLANKVNFGTPVGNLRSSTFGTPTSIQGNQRQIELGFRLDF